ncbi:MAG: NMD3-related protein [Candidatus Thorarchaeota archaeon]
MPNRFCAICGKELVQHDPHFGMCLSCFLKEHPLFEVPDRLSINICLDCGSYSKKDVWIEPVNNELFSIIEEAVQKFLLKPKIEDINFSISIIEESFIFSSKDLLKSLDVEILGILKENSNIKHNQIISLNLNHMLCKNCTNLRGGTYFIAIIQLRVKNEEEFDLIKEVLEEINNYVETVFEKDHRHYISKIEDQKYGVDLYLSTNELMNHLIKLLKSRYNFILKRTKKLVGRDSQKGRNLYRQKTLIKFLPVRNKDVIIIGDEYYSVDNIMKNKVILRGENNTKLIKNYSYFFNENLIKKKFRGRAFGRK